MIILDLCGKTVKNLFFRCAVFVRQPWRVFALVVIIPGSCEHEEMHQAVEGERLAWAGGGFVQHGIIGLKLVH